MKLPLLATAFLLLLSSCSPKISTALSSKPPAALPADAPVLVLGVDEPNPPGCRPIGLVRVGESGTTLNCGYPRMLNEALIQARQHGANVLRLTQVIKPSLASSCWQIQGEMLLTNDVEALKADLSRLQAEAEKQRLAEEKSTLPPGTPYAVLYVFRPLRVLGKGSYDLYLNDSVIYRAQNGSSSSVRLPRPGPVTLRAQGGGRVHQLTLQVEPGQEYFLVCTASGLSGNRPWFNFLPTREGRQEFRRTRYRP